jgi:hypothetical protein
LSLFSNFVLPLFASSHFAVFSSFSVPIDWQAARKNAKLDYIIIIIIIIIIITITIRYHLYKIYNDFKMVPVVPVITDVTHVSTFYIQCASIKGLYILKCFVKA